MTLHLGTSGWQYAHWRGTFYPRGLRQADELAWYARRFGTVEVNATFYRLPRPGIVAGWARRTPGDFVFALKASRFLTHVKRLRDPAEPAAAFMSRASELGEQLGPILLQLPPSLERDDERLAAALAAFPPGVRLAVEMRHESWFVEPVRELLTEHGAALCLADRGSRRVTPLWRTARWTYLRLHEGRAAPHPCYGRRALDSWARELARGWGRRAAAFVYFNNDARACAPRDARLLALAARRHGLAAGRVPAALELAHCPC